MLTQARLKELLHYDPATGIFTRLVAAGNNRIKVGDAAGSLSSSGYQYIKTDGGNYSAHRLAWLYVHGVWPTNMLDHINGIKDANWIDNLREATNAQNMANQGKRITNTSGFKGANWNKRKGKWEAQISIRGKPKHLGYFTTPEEAGEAYQAAAREYHQDFYKEPTCTD
jgi:hypothetical protein